MAIVVLRVVRPSDTTIAPLSSDCHNSHMFTPELLDHFQNPRNAGELPSANTRIEVSNPICGDVLRLSARIENRVIHEVRFLCRGCTASIACASVLTEKLQGQELRVLQTITEESLSEALGGLPPASYHAATLSYHALQQLWRAAAK